MKSQQQDFAEGWRTNFNFGHTFCMAIQRALTVPMRSHYGIEALGWPCVLALALMVIWYMASRDSWMLYWIFFWLLCLAARRLESIRLNLKGARIPSYYDGWPDLMCFCKTENMAKLIGEPVFISLLGASVYWFYTELGWETSGLPTFLLSGVVALPFVEGVKQTIWRKRIQSMVDAKIENEAMISDFRDKYGNL